MVTSTHTHNLMQHTSNVIYEHYRQMKLIKVSLHLLVSFGLLPLASV